MADNVTLNSGVGGATAATDEIGGVHFQRVKLIHGADGVNAGDVAVSNPFPIGYQSDSGQISLTTTPLTASSVYTSPTIDGTTYPYVHVWCFADQQGTLVFQESVDNITFRSSQTFDVRASSARVVHHSPAARYYRYRFTNGSTNQTVFELQVSPKQTGYHDVQMVTLQKGCGFQDTTTTNLGAGGSYSSPAADTSNQGQLFTCAAKSDQAGTMYIEESHNGSTWEIAETISVLANTFTELEHSNKSKFARGRYVNGATPTTGFWFQSLCRTLSVVDRVKIDPNTNTVKVDQGVDVWAVKGAYSHNAAPPSATTGLLSLPAIASASDPTLSEGNVVGLSVGLSGALRIQEDLDVQSSITRTAQSATSVQLAAALANRAGFVLHNDSLANLYVKFGATASVTSYTYKLRPDETLEFTNTQHWEGVIDAIWDAAGGGAAQLTQLQHI